MKKVIYSKEELIRQTGLSVSALKDWEKRQLIKPDGVTKDRTPFYSEVIVERIKHVKGLLDLGYALEDIQKIVKKVGVPKAAGEQDKKAKLNTFLTVGDLADRVGVSPRAIKHWEDKGIIEPDMRSEGGFRLYSETYVYLCKLIKDLQLFGYSLEKIKETSDLFRSFLAINQDMKAHSKADNEKKLNLMLDNIQSLFDRMNLLQEGIERWKDLLRNKKKEILNLKNQNQKRRNPKVSKNE